MIKYLVPAALALLAAAACADHRSDYMEEFQTMVYFRNGGEQELSLFRTGEDGLYQIPICKSGRNLNGEISAVLIPFDEAQISMYNITYETDYKLVPASCYQFVDQNGSPLASQDNVAVDFGPTDPYKVVTLCVNTNEVSALQEADEDAEYVLAFQLFSGGKVSADINYILLKPTIDVPQLALLNAGEEPHKYTPASKEKETYKNTVSLNMDENRWDFTCSLEVKDAQWLAQYNQSKGTKYELLPSALFELPGKVLTFNQGTTEVSFDITITRTGMEMLKEYALPIELVSCSKKEFKIDSKNNVFVLVLRLDPDQITISEEMISVSTQAPGDGGGAPALIDNNVLTYWHSVYSKHNGDPVYGEYVDIALKTPLKSIVFSYCTRSQNGNGVPVCVAVWVRNETSEPWKQVGEDIETDEMLNSVTAQWITLPVLTADSSFRYIRFSVLKANPRESGDLRLQGTTNFTALSELQLYGTN